MISRETMERLAMRVPALAKHHGLTHDGYTYGHQEALYAGDKTSLAAFAADLALRGAAYHWADAGSIATS